MDAVLPPCVSAAPMRYFEIHGAIELDMAYYSGSTRRDATVRCHGRHAHPNSVLDPNGTDDRSAGR